MADETRTPEVTSPNGHPVEDHERRDIPVRLVTRSVFGLALLTALTIAGLAGLWKVFESMTPRENRLMNWTGTRESVPGPRLQIVPERDLAEYLTSQEQRLSSFGWVDKERGRVRIPIDRAIELTVASASAASSSRPTDAPGTQPPPSEPPPLYKPALEQPPNAPVLLEKPYTGESSGRPLPIQAGEQPRRAP